MLNRTKFWRPMLLAIAAIVVVSATFAPTEASAHWRGRGWGGTAIGLGLGLGLAAGYPYYARPAYGYPAYGGYSDGCWRRVIVETPWGPRARNVWVCG